MDLPKYAKWEVERRFLVNPSHMPPLDPTPPRMIDDLYLENGHLRLRSIVSSKGEREYKLCKKYGAATLGVEPVVNIYLSAAEHAQISTLPGFKLRKWRLRGTHAGIRFGVDIFENTLSGLVLAEVEAESPEEAAAIAPPAWAVREVTSEPFFTGGNLCRLTADQLAERLREEGLLCPRIVLPSRTPPP